MKKFYVKREKFIQNSNGITLVALILTIIVLFIIAGVGISILRGNNGVVNQAQSAKVKTEIAEEKEALQKIVVNNAKSRKHDILKDSGEELYDKTIENGNKWRIVFINDTQKTYGTGWKLFNKGTKIDDYGKLKYNWVINMETGDIDELEEGKYAELSYGQNLAVKDSLLLNVDPINMSDNNSWGEGVSLKGVEEGDGYGWNGSAIKLDGVNDYIELYTGAADMNQGITFEFYGKSDAKTIPMLNKTVYSMKVGDFANKFRTYYRNYASEEKMAISMSGEHSESTWKVANRDHWVQKKMNSSFNNENGGYITMTVDINSDTITLYWNGQYVDKTKVSHKWLLNGGLTNNSIPFTIGYQIRGKLESDESDENVSSWNKYAKVDIYACRLYNKILTADEIRDNYNSTVAYHNLLLQEN